MAIDASIPLGIQQTNPFQTVSSMLGVKSQLQQQQLQQQAMQANAMQNQQSAIDLQETQAAQVLMRNIKNYQDSEGNIDFNKISPDLAQAAPKNYAKFMSALAQAQQAHTMAQQSVNNLDADSRAKVGDLLYSLKGQGLPVIQKTLDSIQKSFPGVAGGVQYFKGQLQNVDPHNQEAIDGALDQAGKMVQSAPTQQGMGTPEGIAVDNGQQGAVISTKPGTAVPAGQPIPGTQFQHQLPPTTQTVGPQGETQYLGPQGSGGRAVFDLSGDRIRDMGMLNSIANDASQPADIRAQARAQLQQTQQGRVSASLPPGQAANMQNNVDEMNRHFAGLQDQSSGAALVTGLTGNIKALADQAATGTGGGRKAFVDGLLAALHIPGTGDLQKDTDLLEKNMAQLNLGTPASSDAARTLVAAARPHSSMNAGAIKEAADQVASQVQANMAMRNVLSGYKQMGDVAGYNATRQKLEQIADPRAWQYVNLGPGTPAAKEFIAKLTPSDRKALGEKIQQLEQMGMLK
jgi:hypothetical protein